MKWLIFAFIFQSQLAFAQLDLEGVFTINNGDALSMTAGESTHWNFKFINQNTRAPHTMFMKMHAKPMHTIVVSEDLTYFAHIHPSLDMMTGNFSMKVNDVSADPDNFQSPSVVPYAGTYFAFTEVMPMKPGTDVPMKMNRFQVNAVGAAAPARGPSRYPDASSGITKYFNEKGEPAQEGARYKVLFSYQLFDFCSYYLPKFYFEFYKLDDHDVYKRAEDFNRWLGMGGHSVLIDADERALEDKSFNHLHAFLPLSTAGEFVFPYHNHEEPLRSGIYKIWGQFKDGDVVLTTPFTFRYVVPVGGPNSDDQDFCK